MYDIITVYISHIIIYIYTIYRRETTYVSSFLEFDLILDLQIFFRSPEDWSQVGHQCFAQFFALAACRFPLPFAMRGRSERQSTRQSEKSFESMAPQVSIWQNGFVGAWLFFCLIPNKMAESCRCRWFIYTWGLKRIHFSLALWKSMIQNNAGHFFWRQVDTVILCLFFLEL